MKRAVTKTSIEDLNQLCSIGTSAELTKALQGYGYLDTEERRLLLNSALRGKRYDNYVIADKHTGNDECFKLFAEGTPHSIRFYCEKYGWNWISDKILNYCSLLAATTTSQLDILMKTIELGANITEPCCIISLPERTYFHKKNLLVGKEVSALQLIAINEKMRPAAHKYMVMHPESTNLVLFEIVQRNFLNLIAESYSLQTVLQTVANMEYWSNVYKQKNINLIDITSGNTTTPEFKLSLAAILDDLQALEYLIPTYDLDPNTIGTKSGLSPLHLASIFGSHRVIKSLIKKHNVDIDGYCSFPVTPLHLAVSTNKHSTVKLLLKLGADIDRGDKNKSPPLSWAVEQESKKVCRVLLQNGADPNIKNTSGLAPLHIAILNYKYGLCGLLLQFGADIDCAIKYGTTPILLAAKNSSFKLCKYLATRNANLFLTGRDKKTPLHVAAHKDSTELCIHLIRLGAPLDHIDSKYAPLHYSVINNNLRLCRYLLQKGAMLDIPDSKQRIPFQIALERGRIKIARYLIKKGVKTEKLIPVRGTPPLHYVSQKGWVEFCLLLLKQGYDLHQQDDNGRTAIFGAASELRVKCTETLLAKGLDCTVRDKFGWLPRHYVGMALHTKLSKPDDDFHVRSKLTNLVKTRQLKIHALLVESERGTVDPIWEQSLNWHYEGTRNRSKSLSLKSGFQEFITIYRSAGLSPDYLIAAFANKHSRGNIENRLPMDNDSLRRILMAKDYQPKGIF